ncbi:MAG: O-antigen ligase domain-containing protein [Bacteroidia bacterium]|nr:MAG: O-antigen ligase domain-containing protein [Bacteroidia bacterium]
MNKNSFKQQITKANVAIFLIVAMLVGFLLSRIVLSVAMILFGVNALWNIHPRKWLKEKWWLWGVVWLLLFAVSYFWSDDKAYWGEHLQVKLPILLLPLAYSFIPAFSKRQVQFYILSLCGCLLVGISYSAYFLLNNPAFFIEGYRFSNVLPTLPKDEHIRFTLALALGFVSCFYCYPFLEKRWQRIFIMSCLFVFALAIHVYAVRTGLLAFYLFMFLFLLYLLLRKKTRVLASLAIVVMTLATYSAFKMIPTLENRMNHFKWSIKVFEKGEMNPDYGDIGRYMSYKVALNIIQQHPLLGVGVGDIYHEMSRGYQTLYPKVEKKHFLVPHNQIILIAVGAGLITTVAFVIWLFYPLTEITLTRNGFYYLANWVILLIPILVEPVLEIQYGVYVFIAFLLWQRHLLLHPTNL